MDVQAQMIPLDKLVEGDITLRPAQTDNQKFEGIVTSIRKHGVFTPIVVKEFEDGKFLLVDGCQRSNAARQCGLTHIPARIVSLDDEDCIALQVILNDSRIENSPKQRLNAIKKLMAKHPEWSQVQLAEELCKTQAEISRILTLKRLIPEAMELVDKGEITIANGYALAKNVPMEMQKEYLKQAQNFDMDSFADFAESAGKSARKGIKEAIKEGEVRVCKLLPRKEVIALLNQQEAHLKTLTPEDDDYAAYSAAVEVLQIVLQCDPASEKRRQQQKEEAKLKSDLKRAQEKIKENEIALKELEELKRQRELANA